MADAGAGGAGAGTGASDAGDGGAACVYCIMQVDAWREAVAAGVYTGSALDAKDGFIHMSSGKQVVLTAQRYFKGREDIMLCTIDPSRLDGKLRWDPVAARDGEKFPHLYSSLAWDAVMLSHPLKLGEDGNHVFPDGFPNLVEPGAPRVAYSVRCAFARAGEDVATWTGWLTGGHMLDVMLGGATNASLVRMEDPDVAEGGDAAAEGKPPVYEVRYIFPCRAAFDRYVTTFAPGLKKEGLTKFAGMGLSYSRTLGTVTDRFGQA